MPVTIVLISHQNMFVEISLEIRLTVRPRFDRTGHQLSVFRRIMSVSFTEFFDVRARQQPVPFGYHLKRKREKNPPPIITMYTHIYVFGDLIRDNRSATTIRRVACYDCINLCAVNVALSQSVVCILSSGEMIVECLFECEFITKKTV